MNIDIKSLTREQLVDLQSQIDKQLGNSEYPPRGAICEIYDFPNQRHLWYSNGDGTFSACSDLQDTLEAISYRVIEPGLNFSDKVIKTEDITPEMDKTLCLVWDSNYLPDLRAIDGVSKGVYNHTSDRSTVLWENHRLCTTPYEQMPQWAKDLVDNLED
jgi:hypothetical protein